MRLHLLTIHFLLSCVLYSAEQPLLTPAQSQSALHLLDPNLKIELVAAEPLVIDPVDICFDENGRAYVAEMIDYPFIATPPLGRVRLLEDTDGDGRMDKSTVFAEGLGWPTSVCCANGGVFVAASPSIWFLQDTDGDGKADVRQEIFTGFGKQNVQALLNNIKWSIEHKFVGASGGNGGKVKSPLNPAQPELNLAGRDFAFTPDGKMEPLTGGGQFGNTFDDFGRRFVCSNSVQARHVVLEERYLARNPALLIPSPLANIAADGDAGPVFRTSPVEQWRVTRTQMRITGAATGPVEFGGKVSGYFTSATGITVYRGTALGRDYYGSLFIGDVASNLVHRKKLEPNGATFKAMRVDPGTEFLTSTDTVFRPTNFANAPDGALYICDMARVCIEHPASIPESLKQNLNMNTVERGRIWRVSKKDFVAPKPPKLATATTAELVESLNRPDGWWRDTASRLLHERQDKSAVPLLETLSINKEALPAARAVALWALDGLGALNVETLQKALQDKSPNVREHAYRLAEYTPEIRGMFGLTSERDPRARFQLALSLGAFKTLGLARALLELQNGASQPPFNATPYQNDSWTRAAIVSSSSSCAPELMKISQFNADEEFRRDLAFTIGVRNVKPEIEDTLDAARTSGALSGLAEGLLRKRVRLIEQYPNARRFFGYAANAASDRKLPEPQRLDAIRALAYADFQTAGKDLHQLLFSHEESLLIEIAALRSLAVFDDDTVAEKLLASWSMCPRSVRAEALRSLFTRPARLPQLSAALEKKKISVDELTPELRKLLKIKTTSIDTDRKALIARYKPSLDLKGDPARGKELHQKNCATCHRAAGAGHDLGPDLETVTNRSSEELLTAILDPNREVQAQYCLATIKTTDGRVLEGILTSQTAASVTLKRAQGETSVVLRSEIAHLVSGSTSPMPEELEKTLDFQQMADVIEFVKRLGK